MATAPARTVSYLAVASAYLLIVAGGLVRATGSGLGCPDWPLCQGQPLPPALPAPMIEFSHRLLASVTTVLAVLTSVLIFRAPASPRLRALALAAPFLLIAQIGLGALTVLLELPSTIVTAHLALALLLLGLLVTEAVALTPNDRSWDSNDHSGNLGTLAVATAAAVYVQAILGGIVRGSGASLACTGFPLCNGELVPALTPLVSLHLLHRLGALVVLCLLAALFWKSRAEAPGYRTARLATAALLLACFQAAVGVFAVTASLPTTAQVLHVAGAAAVWAAAAGAAASAVGQPGAARITLASAHP